MSRGGPPPVIERDDGRVIDLTTAIGRHRRIDTAFEIYLGLYQAVTGPEERQKLFREFSPGFFDLIVIDECHRGSAAEDSAWREILEYFSGRATHRRRGSSASAVPIDHTANITTAKARARFFIITLVLLHRLIDAFVTLFLKIMP